MSSSGNAAPWAWIARFAPAATGPVLDLACGSGRHTRHFLDRGLAVTAVDRDVSRLADIAAHPDLSVIAADLEAGADP
jgi:SAM-dependent methyltransferase